MNNYSDRDIDDRRAEHRDNSRTRSLAPRPNHWPKFEEDDGSWDDYNQTWVLPLLGRGWTSKEVLWELYECLPSAVRKHLRNAQIPKDLEETLHQLDGM